MPNNIVGISDSTKLGTTKDQKIIKKLSKKGGSVKSPQKKLMAKITSLRRRNLMNDKDSKDLYEFLTDPELGAVVVFEQINKLKGFKDPDSISRHAKLLIELHKQIHGLKTKNTNFNINGTITQEMANVVIDKLFEGLPKNLVKAEKIIEVESEPM